MDNVPRTITPKALLYLGIYGNLEKMLSEQKQAVCDTLHAARKAMLGRKDSAAAEELSDLLCLLGVDGVGVERVHE